ncbi:diaminopimelate epimerase [Limoniibacter endophyticus]|uniref:Diaminopimelate epimerase n=2 Tax=Limoniibacter endophyticus TaxID=1565040 RepID=A0A8J3DJF5_9HYPH|nr:diaminopimelate epimerase [Limoniibacter endophyticus]
MNGLGNRIIVADMRSASARMTSQAAIALASDPITDFDQIMVIYPPRATGTDYYIDILNRDGSQAGACGNGTRCVVRALAGETGKTNFTFQTPGGIVSAREHVDGLISVDMGKPEFSWDKIPLTEEFADTRNIELQVGPIDAPLLHTPAAVSMGNPHIVFWVEQDVRSYELEKFGPLLENHPLFPERVNVTIAKVEDRHHLIIRTWERGAGLTLACGTAACAAAVNAARTGRAERQVRVTLPGGDLHIDWRADDHVMMTGPAEWEFSGRLDPETGAWERDTDAEDAA